MNQTQPKSLKKGLHYYFGHSIMPKMVFNNTDNFYQKISDQNGLKFLQYIWVDLGRKLNDRLPLDGLNLSNEKIDENTEAFIIHFPTPKNMTEPFYTAAVFRKNKNKLSKDAKNIRYFTAELGLSKTRQLDGCIFCEWDAKGAHTLVGPMKNNDIKTFLAAIKSTVQEG